MRNRIPLIAAFLTPILPVSLAAAAARRPHDSPQPIYAAFSLVKQGKLRTQRCGTYSVTTGTYTGRSASPDARLAGAVRYVGRVAVQKGGPTGVAGGTLTIHDDRGRRRMRASVNGVLTQGAVVNGLVAGTLLAPNALLLANVTIVYDDRLSFAVFRLGLESGQNTAVAYPRVPNCR